MGLKTKAFALLLAFDALAAIIMAAVLLRGGWRLLPFLFALTLIINFVFFMSRKQGAQLAPARKGRRSVLVVGYVLIVAAALQTPRFLEGWSWLKVVQVLFPLVIGGLFLRLAARVKPP